MADPDTHHGAEGDAPISEPADAAPAPDASAAAEPSTSSPEEGEGGSEAAAGAEAAATEEVFPAAARSPSARPSANAAKAKATAASPLAAYEAIARSPRLPDLVAITKEIVGAAGNARRSVWDFTGKVTAAAQEAKLSRAESATPFGNALEVLGRGAESDTERALAAALWAHAIAESRRDDEDALASDILWLAAHTAFDATPLLDRALGDEADEVWTAIGGRIRRFDEGAIGARARGEAIVGCVALATSRSEAARKIASELAERVRDPMLARVLTGGASAPVSEVRLEGEATPAPRGPVATALLAVTGILFAMHALGLVARLALAYRRPAEVTLSESGVRMRTRTQMLGRTLREREHVITRAGLVRVVREVRYPRAAFYAGLLALAVGSYVGVRTFVDGVRAASPSLLLVGLAVVALGVALDFVLGSLLPGARARVHVAFVPRTGKVLCIGNVDAARADDALARAISP